MITELSNLGDRVSSLDDLAGMIFSNWLRIRDELKHKPVPMPNLSHIALYNPGFDDRFGCNEDSFTARVIFYFNGHLTQCDHEFVSDMIASVMFRYNIYLKKDYFATGIPKDRCLYVADLYYRDWPALAKNLMFEKLAKNL
jgi:hypothetical protein